MVDTTAAVNPIVMASHGWWITDMGIPTATPPASMHDCIWIWQGSGDKPDYAVFGVGLVASVVLKQLFEPTVTIHGRAQWWVNISSVRSYQVEFSLGTGEHRQSSCCYSTDSQGQVGATYGRLLPPWNIVIHKDWIETGPKHPEKQSTWRTQRRGVSSQTWLW